MDENTPVTLSTSPGMKLSDFFEILPGHTKYLKSKIYKSL